MQPNTKYTYENAGFNSFLARSRKSNPFAERLNDGASSSSGTTLNLDRQQINGSLGNTLTIGTITLDGVNGKISLYDNNGNEVGRIGDLSV